MVLKYLIFGLLLFPANVSWAGNIKEISQDGFNFKIETELYAYEPNDVLSIHYEVINIDYFGVQFSFPSSKRTDIIIHTPAGLAGSPTSRYQFVPGDEYLARGDVFRDSMKLTLNEFLAVRNDTAYATSVSDGDTLIVRGSLATSRFGVGNKVTDRLMLLLAFSMAVGSQTGDENYNANLDITDDGVVSFPDLVQLVKREFEIVDNRTFFPDPMTEITVFIRAKTADLNRDTSIDSSDFDAFRQRFGFEVSDFEYDARADLNGNGIVDFLDFLEFVDLFQKKR